MGSQVMWGGTRVGGTGEVGSGGHHQRAGKLTGQTGARGPRGHQGGRSRGPGEREEVPGARTVVGQVGTRVGLGRMTGQAGPWVGRGQWVPRRGRWKAWCPQEMP